MPQTESENRLYENYIQCSKRAIRKSRDVRILKMPNICIQEITDNEVRITIHIRQFHRSHTSKEKVSHFGAIIGDCKLTIAAQTLITLSMFGIKLIGTLLVRILNTFSRWIALST